MPWTNVLKPSESSVVTSVIVLNSTAQPFGLLMIITSTIGTGSTSSVTGSSITSGWTNINKPTGSGWTNINKPIS